ncbi:alpha/beta fold hydrolase [Robertkochia sediminum]|uniref:alpha/beta fold hydrolase n=1 Tax=Robertkochia sediminum TaxID=2785326 RepID=UPI001932DD27|nr:alpha/beta hydrolase [Robertkochia sediminum]MBL7473623.1 alpha/beta hydrolase [Robertkochia sediminum]
MPDQKTSNTSSDIKVPLFIKLPAKILEKVSPSLAAKFAARLFCTPFKFGMPEREYEMDQQSRQERLIVPGIGKEIVVYHYGKAAKKVLLVHGWSGRGTQLSVIADRLLQEGYSTVSFDAPAHGKATGKQTEMLEFIASCLFLTREFGPFEFGIGHSLGAMTLLQSMNRGAQFKKLVLIGSGNLVWDIMQDFTKKLGLKPITGIQMKRYFDEISGMDTQELSAELVAPGIDIPVMVIHDTDDEDVPVSAAHAIHAALPHGELMITSGLGHRKILGDPEVIAAAMTFLKK